MVVYIITILFAISLSYAIQYNKENVKEKGLIVFLMLILIFGLAFVVGYRYNVGTDFWEYKRMFTIYKNYSWAELLKVKEPGIRFIVKLCSYVSNNYSFYMFVCAILTTTIPIIVLYKHSENFTISMILYLFLNYLAQCNGMRQALAISIIFLGYKYIKNRKFWKFLIFPLIASIFHVSSLFIIPIYFIYVSKPSFWFTIIVLSITIVLRFSYDWLASTIAFFSGEEFETTSYSTQSVNILRIIAMGAPIVLSLLLSKSQIQDNSTAFNMLLVNACVYLCMAGSAYFARFGMFTDMFLCIAIPPIISKYKESDKVFISLIMLSCFAFFFLVNTMNVGNLVPYQSVLW